MRKRYRNGLIIIGIITIILVIVAVINIFVKKEEAPKNTTIIISNIEKYGYSLDDRDTLYMKNTFEELKSILDQNEINLENYASTLSKLFIIDFYTLNNKINKYDVGSIEYILDSRKESFKNKAMDTIYKDVIDNTYKDRIQELPEVSEVEILSVIETTYKLSEKDVEAYKTTAKINYKKDLGYDIEATIYLIKNDKKLEIVNFNPKIEED